MRLEVRRRTFTLAQPYTASHGTLHEREVAIVRVIDADGADGFGEAAPLAPYDGVTMEAALAALERCREPLARHRHVQGAGAPQRVPGGDGARVRGPDAALLAQCAAACAVPQALAAIDIALWDLAARREGVPLAALLAALLAAPRAPAAPAVAVTVNASISALDRARASDEAARAVARGFRTLKVKIGHGDDAGRVAAVRAATGAHVALRLDANGAFDVPRARATIEALAPAGLELVEEPVHGVAATRELRALVDTRIAIDETAAEPGALEPGVADAVCLKVARCGGLTRLLAAARTVREGGAEVYLASTLDGPLGIAAALHAAAALAAARPLPACGLATLALFERVSGAPEGLCAHDGAIAVPSGAGLGVEGA
jgi:L-alanine-DL-glutamate epimerase-like enolase superfamily enzyme